MKHLCRLTATALCLLATALFTACGNSNKKESPTPLSLSDMAGEYAGTFDFTPSPSSLNPSPEAQNGVEVSLRVEDGRIVIPRFPASTLVTALLGEEQAGQLLTMLGDISYEVEIGTPTADDTQLTATLTAPQLRIDLAGVLVVLIDIEAPAKMTFTRSGTLAFTLRTTRCQLGEGASAGEPFELVNELKFKLTRK